MEVTTKQHKKIKRKIPLVYIIMSIVLIITSFIANIHIIYEGIFSLHNYLPIFLLNILIVLIIAFILCKTHLRLWIKNIFNLISIIIILCSIIMIFFGTETLKFLASITDTGYRVETYGIYVLKDSNYKTIKDLENKKISYLEQNDNSTLKALEILNEEVVTQNENNKSINSLLNKLKNNETDAILISTAFETLIKEEFESIYKNLKLIKEIDVIDMVEILKSNKNIMKEPFIVYISGIDTSGMILSNARSDVNIIFAVNPSTHNVLLLNTPRDYYVNLHSKGAYDKLTHAGLYGIEESLMTLSDLYNVEIDYYARVNFTSFMKIVDALGGIEVDVFKDFCEQDSNRSFKEENLICLKKGKQTLNGEEALALVRHRKTINDRIRGQNQMQVIEAIIDKALSPKIITRYSKILSSLEGRVSTNLTTNEMYLFSKKQIKDNEKWNITSLSVTGSDASKKAYATGDVYVSVIMPDDKSLTNARKALNNLINGEIDVLKGLE